MTPSQRPHMLVLGANGFIGKSCIEYFQEDYDITGTLSPWNVGLDSKYPGVHGIEFRMVELRNEDEVKDLIADVNPDIIIQAAATTTNSKDVIEAPWLHITDNVVMNSWIFREAHLQGVKHVIFPSCTVMYQPMEKAQKEDDWARGEGYYPPYFGVASMKVFCEDMCQFYAGLGKTVFTAIRHSNVYGPGDKFDLDKCHLVPAMVNKVCNSEGTLEVWGNGLAKRDVLYINDLVRLIDLAIHKQIKFYELYNCGIEHAYSVKEIIHSVQSAANKPDLELKFDTTKPDIPTTVVLDCEKAHRELGWYPEYTLKDGIIRTVNWYEQNYLNKV